jgi:hypothetical protein
MFFLRSSEIRNGSVLRRGRARQYKPTAESQEEQEDFHGANDSLTGGDVESAGQTWPTYQLSSQGMNCHPERSDGSGYLLGMTLSLVSAKT